MARKKPITVKQFKKWKKPEYAAAPEQSHHSDKLVNRALYWIQSKADDVSLGRQDITTLQAQVDALDNLNIPVVCQKTAEMTSGKPVFYCYKYPPWDTNPPKTRRR